MANMTNKQSQLSNNLLMVRMLEQTKQQDDENAKDIRIKNINRYLKSTQDYRSMGLISLSDFLELHSVNSSSFVSEKDCQELEWIEIILRFLDQKSETPDSCFPIIRKLLTITTQNNEMKKIVQSKYVRKIVETLTSLPQSISSLQCLATLLKEYSGPSGVFKNQIYNYCIAIVDEMDFNLVNYAGICLNLLQQTRGGEFGGTGHQKNWAEFHEMLLNTLDEQFTILLDTGEDTKAGKSEKLKLPEIKIQKDMPFIYTLQERFIRFKNICIIFEATLTQSFPSPKTILLGRIISFVDKRTTFNHALLNKKDEESHVPHILHIEIQKCLLSLLKSTIIAVNSNILLYSKDVCDIIWKCLKSTNIAYNEFKISGNLSLRNTVYDLLIEFMKVSPNNHFVYKNIENFMKEALLDIIPLQNEVVLTLPNTTSKSKKKKGANSKLTLTKSTLNNCLKLHQNICAKSLEFLFNLVIYNGAAMKPVLYKILLDKVLSISFKIISKDLTKYDLYYSSECRMKILELNYALITHSSSRNATPMSFSIEIFKKFKDSDTDPKIRHRSFELVKNVESILHNRKDPIHFPPDLKDFRDTWLFNEKIVKAFEEIDREKFEKYKNIYELSSNAEKKDDLNEKHLEESKSKEKESEDEESSVDGVDLSGKNNDEGSDEEKTNQESENDDVEMKEEHKESEHEEILAAKKKMFDKTIEGPPKKIAKESTPENLKNNFNNDNNDDEMISSYLEDFCGDVS